MTAPMLMTQHLTDETLAAYVDDRLDSATREPVTQHLASCGECREIVLMTTAYQADVEPANVTRGNFGARRWMAAIAGIAAALMIVVIMQPSSSSLREYRDRIVQLPKSSWEFTMKLLSGRGDIGGAAERHGLVAASQSLRERPSAGRLAGKWAYSAEPSTMRGGAEDDDFGAKAKLLQLRIEAEEARVPDPHILGLTRLLTAEKGATDVTAAVTSLYSAYREASGEERDSIAIDLAAALITYARWSGQPDQNHAQALELSNDVLKRHPKRPEALWNRAIALGALNRTDEAKRAWDDYLNVDPDSQWAEEAKRHQSRLQPDF